jgi:hypothetical protein
MSEFEFSVHTTIIVADEIARRRVPGECLHNLLRQPLRRWMPSHCKLQQPASTMAQDKKRKQAVECQGWDHAEVDRRDGICMVA